MPYKRCVLQVLTLLKSIVFVLVILKVFKVLRFNRFFRVLLQTFSIAGSGIFYQFVTAFIVFLAFAVITHCIFVSSLEGYRDFPSSLMSLFAFSLGESDFQEYYENSPILGPIIYFAFVVVFIIIMLSIFTTVILESFNVARLFVILNAEEQHFLRYCNRIFRQLIGAEPKIKQVRRQRRTHPFKPASCSFGQKLELM